jgi:hypothetical protein
LKDTGFSVSEQFPQEIIEKRKLLYPEIKKTKEAGKKAKLVRDKLIIEGKEFRSHS